MLRGALLSGNRAGNQGGGLAQANGSSDIDAATFVSNSAKFRGGGIYALNVATFTVDSNSHINLNYTRPT